MPTLRACFEQLVADLDYPVYVVTAAAETGRAGCLVGFVTQASIDPPRLMVLLSKANETFRVASRAEVLVVHYLGAGDKDLAALFGEESGDWSDKFDRCDWTEGPHGTPVLAGVRGWVAGRIMQRLDAGDHVAHVLEPVAAGVSDPAPPLMLRQVHDLDAGHPA